MLLSRPPVEPPTLRRSELDEFAGVARRPGPALHVKVDGHRVVERRATELRRLQRQFSGVVTRTSRFQDDSLEAWRGESYVPARQRWSDHLERDVRAVCSEAGLSPAAAAAVVDASRRGVISQNPGVLLSRLLRFQECLSQPLGRRGVLSVLRTAPSLLRYSPDSLGWNAEMLAALLPDGDAVASAVRKAPMLLGASAITLWGNFEGLRQLLCLDHDAALRLVVRAPRLLLNSRGALEGRLEGLVLLAGGGASRRRVAAAVARQPALLGYFPGTLERNLRGAAAALRVPFARVQPLLLKQPALAMLARDSLRQRVAALRDAAGLYDTDDLAAVVLRQPSLLTLSPETVRRKVGVVAAVLGLQGRPDVLRGVLRGAPQLLTLAADSIAAKAELLRAAAAPSAALAAQLERAPPQAMALWLCMSSRRYERVQAAAVAEAEAAAEAGTEAATTEAEVLAVGGTRDTLEALEGCEGVMVRRRQGFGDEDPGIMQLACGGATTAVLVDSWGAAPPGRRRGRPRRVTGLDSPLEGRPPEVDAATDVAVVAAAKPSPAGEAEGGGAAAARGGSRRPRLSLYALLRDAAPAVTSDPQMTDVTAGASETTSATSTAEAAADTAVPVAVAAAEPAARVSKAVVTRGHRGAEAGRRKAAAAFTPAAEATVASTGAAAGTCGTATAAAATVGEAAGGVGPGSTPGAAESRPRRRLRLPRPPRESLGL